MKFEILITLLLISWLSSRFHNRIANVYLQAEMDLNDAISERNELNSHAAALERARGALEEELGATSAALAEREKAMAGLGHEKEAIARQLAEMEVTVRTSVSYSG